MIKIQLKLMLAFVFLCVQLKEIDDKTQKCCLHLRKIFLYFRCHSEDYFSLGLKKVSCTDYLACYVCVDRMKTFKSSKRFSFASYHYAFVLSVTQRCLLSFNCKSNIFG